jgi:pilus assembly protein Flp/PilA
MNKFFTSAKNSIRSFAKEEEGAQVVEYALIIAVVSIALVLALKGLTGTTGGFSVFITRVANCLTGAAACSVSL